MNFRRPSNSPLTGPESSRRLGSNRGVIVLILYFGSASLLWIYLWLGEIKWEMGGYNTAPAFVKVVWKEGAPMEERGRVSFKGRSATSGKDAPPERLEIGETTIFRWTWVLLDQISIVKHSTAADLVHYLEVSVDPSCDNERSTVPTDLSWRVIAIPEDAETPPEGRSLALPPQPRSLLPRPPIQNALNWGGDSRLLSKSFLGVSFPYTLFLIIGLVLLGVSGLNAGLRVLPPADSGAVAATTLPSSHRKRRTAFFLSVVFLLFLIAAVLGRPVFDVNDDFHLTVLMAGLFQGPQGFRVLFMNSLLALPLVGLYAAFPMLPWYGFLHFAVLSVSTVVLGWCLVLVARPKVTLLLGTTFLIGVAYLAMTRLTFTLVAGIASGAGWIGMGTAFFLASRATSNSGPIVALPRGLLYTSAGLLFVGSLFRFEAALLIAALLLPFALYLVIATGMWRSLARPSGGLRRVVGVAALSVVVCFAAHMGDRLLSYRLSAGWSSWHGQNEDYSNLVDSYSPEFRKAIDEESILLPDGWTFADAAVLSRFYTNEPHLRDPKALAALAKSVSLEARISRENILTRGDLALRELFSESGLFRPILGYLAVLLLASLILLPLRTSRHLLVILLGTLLLYVLVSVTHKTAPYRVTYALLFACAAVIVLFLSTNIGKRPAMPRMAVAFGALVLAATYHVVWHLTEFPARRERTSRYLEELQALAEISTDTLLIFHMPNQAQPVLSSLPDLRPTRGIPISYLRATPFATVISERIGRDGLVSMMQKDGHALLLTAGKGEIPPRQWSDDINAFETYLTQHLGYPIKSHVVKDLSLWRIVEFSRADVVEAE